MIKRFVRNRLVSRWSVLIIGYELLYYARILFFLADQNTYRVLLTEKLTPVDFATGFAPLEFDIPLSSRAQVLHSEFECTSLTEWVSPKFDIPVSSRVRVHHTECTYAPVRHPNQLVHEMETGARSVQERGLTVFDWMRFMRSSTRIMSRLKAVWKH